MIKNELLWIKFWFKGRVFFFYALILFSMSISNVQAQLNNTLFLLESPLNAAFYPLNSSIYVDFSSSISLDSKTTGFREFQANIQYNFLDLNSAVVFSFINQKHFLSVQQYFSFAYQYTFKISKRNRVSFYSSVSYSRQAFDLSSLVFPSELENLNTENFYYNEFLSPSVFYAINSGIKINYDNFQMKGAWRNMAHIWSSSGFANKVPEYFVELDYKIKNTIHNNSFSYIYQPLIGLSSTAQQSFYFFGLRVLNNRYFSEARLSLLKFEPRLFSFAIGVSLGNVIFAYQNTSTLMGVYTVNLNYNGIKIVYDIKKNQKRQSKNAISCPQF